MKRYLLLVWLGLSVAACKKTEPQTFTGPRAEGRVSFLQEEMVVKVTPSMNSVTIPVCLTRPDRSQTLVANVLLGKETTAEEGRHFQMQTVTPDPNGTLVSAYPVALFSPGDTAALFSITLAPTQIDKSYVVELCIPDTYNPFHMDPIIRQLSIRLEPVTEQE